MKIASLRRTRHHRRNCVGWLIILSLASSSTLRAANVATPITQAAAALELTDQELTQALRNLQEFYTPVPLTPEPETKAAQAEIVEELAATVVKDAAAVAAPAAARPAPAAQPLNPTPSITPPAGNRMGRLISATLLFGQKQQAFNLVNDIVKKLQVPGDPTRYTLHFSGDPTPNASVGVGGSPVPITITAGLLGYVKNVDELASVIAHEMTHANPEYMKTVTNNEDIERILSSLSGFKELETKQQEELRADLGAMDRMIRAGYNPWAHADLEKRFGELQQSLYMDRIEAIVYKKLFSKNFAYQQDHPVSEVRVAAAKAFMLWKKGKVDLSDHTSKYTKLSPAMTVLSARMKAYQFSFTNKWAMRAQASSMVYAAAQATGVTDSKLWKAVGNRTVELSQPITEAVGTAAEPVTRVLSKGAGVVWDAASSAIGYVWTPVREQFANSNISFGTVIATAMSGRDRSATAKAIQMTFFPKNYEIKEIKAVVAEAARAEKALREISATNDPMVTSRKLVEIATSLTALQENFQVLNRRHPILTSLGGINGIELNARRSERLQLALTEQMAQVVDKLNPEQKKEIRKPIFEFLDDTTHAVRSNRSFFRAESKIFDSLVSPTELATIDPSGGFARQIQRSRLMVEFMGREHLTAPERFSLAVKLHVANLKKPAGELMTENFPKFVELVYGKDKVSPDDAKKFTEIFEDEKVFGERGTRGRAGESQFDSAISGQILKSWLKDPGDRFAIQSFAAGVSRTESSFMPGAQSRRAFRSLVESSNRKILSAFMERNFKSLSELVSFIETELGPRNVAVENLALEFYRVVKQHPEWIRTKADVDALLRSRAFWPSIRGINSRLGSMERHLINQIQEAANRYPKMWEFEPGAAEALHEMIVSGLKSSGEYPKTFDEKMALWKSLTTRGITTTTDRFFTELFATANPTQKAELKALALDGHVWEEEIRSSIIRENVTASPHFQSLLTEKDEATRKVDLEALLELVKKSYPEKGNGYRDYLEDISNKIRSTQAESALIQQAKGYRDPGKNAQDSASRTLSAIVHEALGWKNEQQWNFIKYLRGDIEATPHIQKSFQAIGPERVRRMYTLMPVSARAGLIDLLLDSKKGLIPKLEMGQGYTKKIVEHLVRSGTPQEKEVSIQILDAFLYSLKAVGDQNLQSSTLGYLLAVSKKGDGPMSTGEVLKNVLEQFGTTGVKIGQFLSAAKILSPKENKFLEELHERANIPERDSVYKDLGEIVGSKDGKINVPVRLNENLGSASIKYTMSATEEKSGEDVVLKVLRLSAIAKTRGEFKQLEAMADYLRKVYGPKFGVFKSIVRASRIAVEKELSLKDEVAKGRIAGKVVYPDKADGAFDIHVPREILIRDRLIAAEFAPGTAIDKLPAAAQEKVIGHMLAMEEANLFSNERDVIFFDPDRHPGNTRVAVDETGEKIKFSPIDFGQLTSITRQQRDQIVELFSVAQILKQTGKTAWAVDKIARTMGLNDEETKKLAKSIGQYFPAKNISEPGAYFSVLSALDEAGKTTDIVFFDFVRGIIQHSRYDDGRPKDSKSPTQTFRTRVEATAAAQQKEMTLSKGEKAKIGVRMALDNNFGTAAKEGAIVPMIQAKISEVTSKPGVKVPIEFAKGAGSTYVAELVSAVFWGLVDRDKTKAKEFLDSLATTEKHVGFGAFAVSAELYKTLTLSVTELAKVKTRYLHEHGGSMAIGMIGADLATRRLKGESWEEISHDMVSVPYGAGIAMGTANFMVAGVVVGKVFDHIEQNPNYRAFTRVTSCPNVFGKLGKLSATFIVAEGLHRAYGDTLLGLVGADAESVGKRKEDWMRNKEYEAERAKEIARIKELDAIRERYPQQFSAVERLEYLNTRSDYYRRPYSNGRATDYDRYDSERRRQQLEQTFDISALEKKFGQTGYKLRKQLSAHIKAGNPIPGSETYSAVLAIQKLADSLADPKAKEFLQSKVSRATENYLTNILNAGDLIRRIREDEAFEKDLQKRGGQSVPPRPRQTPRPYNEEDSLRYAESLMKSSQDDVSPAPQKKKKRPSPSGLEKINEGEEH